MCEWYADCGGEVAETCVTCPPWPASLKTELRIPHAVLPFTPWTASVLTHSEPWRVTP